MLWSLRWNNSYLLLAHVVEVVGAVWWIQETSLRQISIAIIVLLRLLQLDLLLMSFKLKFQPGNSWFSVSWTLCSCILIWRVGSWFPLLLSLTTNVLISRQLWSLFHLIHLIYLVLITEEFQIRVVVGIR